MMTKNNRSMTAAEHSRLLEADPEFVKQREIREIERVERSARLREEEEPILKDLREIGWDLDSVWDLVNISTPYTEAVPILLKHLVIPYSDRIKEGLARSLAMPEPEVRKAWNMLVEEYKKALMGWGIKIRGDTKEFRLGAKDGLACTLAAIVTDETLEELIALANDPQNGSSRVLLLSPLKRRRKKNPRVIDVLKDLANDPDLKKEIASWK